MKTFTLIAGLLFCFIFNDGFAQIAQSHTDPGVGLRGKTTGVAPLEKTLVKTGQYQSQTKNPDEPTLSSTPIKTKLNSDQLNSWTIDFKNNRVQYLHLKVKKRFSIGSLLKAITPFAVAKGIDKTVANQTPSNLDSRASTLNSPITLSAGVVAGLGAASQSKKKHAYQLFFWRLNKRGQTSTAGTAPITITEGTEVVVPMEVCDPVEQAARIGVVGPKNGKIEISVSDQATPSFSTKGKIKVVSDWADPCDAINPGGSISDTYYRVTMSQDVMFITRNVVLTWTNNYQNLTATSYLTGFTMGAGFQQTGQTVYYDPSTGTVYYTIYGIQSYSAGMGPVQGTMYQEDIEVWGSYNPNGGGFVMNSR